MDFGLAEGDTDAEDRTLPILPDPDGDENGAIQELPALADLFISGVQDHVGIASQRAIPPGLEFDIKLDGAGADLGGTDGMAAEFLDDFGDFAGGDALDIHLPSLRSALRAACGRLSPCGRFGQSEQEGADTEGEGFGFESIGSPQALLAPLVGAGLQDGGAFLDPGLVDEQVQDLGKTGGTFSGEELQNGCPKFRVISVGPVCVFVGCVCRTPTGNHTGQPPANIAQAPSGAGCAPLAFARRRRKGRSDREEPNYRTNFTPAGGGRSRTSNRRSRRAPTRSPGTRR